LVARHINVVSLQAPKMLGALTGLLEKRLLAEQASEDAYSEDLLLTKKERLLLEEERPEDWVLSPPPRRSVHVRFKVASKYITEALRCVRNAVQLDRIDRGNTLDFARDLKKAAEQGALRSDGEKVHKRPVVSLWRPDASDLFIKALLLRCMNDEAALHLEERRVQRTVKTSTYNCWLWQLVENIRSPTLFEMATKNRLGFDDADDPLAYGWQRLSTKLRNVDDLVADVVTAMTNEGLSPNAHTLDALIQLKIQCVEQGLVPVSQGNPLTTIQDLFNQYGSKPSVESYSNILMGFLRAGDHDEARRAVYVAFHLWPHDDYDSSRPHHYFSRKNIERLFDNHMADLY